METANDTAMHVTETKTLCSSLPCPKSKREDISKEKEEELLYGNNEDGDEEDALSDDSMRLRLSDDEAETDDARQPELEGSIMERGLGAPETDIVEQKSALPNQSLSNGNCKDESDKKIIKEEEEETIVDYSNDDLPLTNNFHIGTNKSEQLSSSVNEPLTSQMVNNQWDFPSHSQGRLNRPNRNTLTRSTYLQSNRFYDNADIYNNKYYNTNVHYRGGKGNANRGYHSHFREFQNFAAKFKGQYESKDLPPIRSRRDSDPGVQTKRSDLDDKKSNNSDANQTKPSMDSNFENIGQLASVKIEKRTEDTNNSSESNIDKAEAASNSDKNVESAIADKDGIENNTTENLESNRPELKTDRETNQVDARCEDQTVANDTGNSKDIVETSPSASYDNFDENTEEGKDSSADELPPIIYEEEPQTDSDTLENRKQETEINTKNIVNNVKPKESIESSSNETSSGNVEAQSIAEAAIITDKSDNSDAEIIKLQEEECTKTCETGTETIHTVENIASKEDEKKDNNEIPEESSSDTSKSETTTDSDTESERSSSTSSLTSEKQFDDADSEKTLSALAVVDANDGKEIKNNVVPPDQQNVSEISKAEKEISDVLQDKKVKLSEEGVDDKNASVMHSSLKRMPTESLDEMELSKRMRIQRQKLNESSEPSVNENDEALTATKDNDDTVLAKPITDLIPDSKDTALETPIENNTSKDKSIVPIDEQQTSVKSESVNDTGEPKKTDDCEVIEVTVKQKKKRSRRSLNSVRDNIVSQDDTQEKENVRQKRRTAQNAEEIIRKEFCDNGSDSESSDNAEKYVAVNYNKSNNNMRAASPPTLKRNFIEDDDKNSNSSIKKQKTDTENNCVSPTKIHPITRDNIQTLRHVRRFFRRDENGKLAKIKQEELEELLIQKIMETITQRDEIGKLREDAKTAERKLEGMRLKCYQLEKQVKDFDMVLNRYTADRRANPDKIVTPIKINRSVGLQVNFVTDQGIQNLRQLQQSHQKPAAPPAVNGTSPLQNREENSGVSSVLKRTIKVRSPRRPECPPRPPVLPPLIAPAQSQPTITPVSPAALVVGKSTTDTRPTVTATVQPATVQQIIASNHQTIVMNGTIANQPIRQPSTVHVPKSKNNDLIDLTQEEEKTKTTAMIPQTAILTPSITDSISSLPKIQPRYHTVIQAIPGSMAITGPPSIRVVQPSSQPTPTALVNNMNAPRLTYLMQSNLGQPRQLVLTSTPTPIRPATTHNRNSFPMTSLTTLSNGTVRVIPTAATTTLSTIQHPAALPDAANSASNPSWKLPPPSPSLKISKVSNGIVLSWNMALSDKYADIERYQLYAYQEVIGVPPNSALWKKVGDVRALPLPMACTLTQFSEGNNYYFAVRAVDKHSRPGQYSQPGNISL